MSESLLMHVEELQAKVQALNSALRECENEARALCYEIEKLPASKQQSDLSLQASALYGKLRDIANAG